MSVKPSAVLGAGIYDFSSTPSIGGRRAERGFFVQYVYQLPVNLCLKIAPTAKTDME